VVTNTLPVETFRTWFWPYLLSPENVGEVANRVLIASRFPLELLDFKPIIAEPAPNPKALVPVPRENHVSIRPSRAPSKLADGLFVNPAIRGYLPNSVFIPLSKQILHERIDNSASVVIISAYYDIDFLTDLFAQRRLIVDKKIYMIFARPAPSALPEQVPQLIRFQQMLRKASRKGSVTIAVSDDSRFLHTKLYQFRRGKWVRTLIGSANATSNGFERNDEILIEVHGANNAIDHYIKSTVHRSCNCEHVDLTKNERYTDFETMLRDGYVYFKPTRSVPYTLNCFDNKPEIAEALQKAIVGRENPLPGHEGQSFGMLNILRLLQINPRGQASRQDTAQRVKIIPFSIETAFGYWVPVPYRAKLEKRLDSAAQRKTAAYLQCGRELSELIVKREYLISAAIDQYLQIIEGLLRGTHPHLSKADKEEINSRIRGRVTALQKKLGNEAECQRLARSLDGVPVPEIWEDPRSKNEMVDSFCEYVAWKLASPTRVPGIVQTLRDWFELKSGDEPDAIREKIDRFFGADHVSRSDWGIDIDDDAGDEDENAL
jgi:hypothetical protein